jgi:multidrug efflux system outer membrane protein
MQTHPTSRASARRSLALLLPAFGLLAACVVGPDYQRPSVATPDSFRGAPPAASGQAVASIAEQPWQSVFADPVLQSLIQEGLANNLDLQVAAARIEQARALVGTAESEGRPQVGYGAFAGHEKSFVPAPGSGSSSLEYTSVGGLLNAAWELDVWGRIKRATEAAKANLMAQEDVRHGVTLILVSDIAAGYFRLLELDREQAIAEESSRVFRQTLELFTMRFEAGRDSRLPVERTQALYDASTAKAADLRRAIAVQENALSILVGSNPRDIARGHPLDAQSMPATPLGATTDLLQRRPDILSAEQTMVRANAEIGEAIAERYPKIGLSALLGGIGADVGHGWDSFGVWNIAAGLAGPIFTGGRLTELYNQRKAFWDESIAGYRKTVQVAFKETADALAAQKHLVAQRQGLESQVAALQRSTGIALDRYQAGRASYFEVLEAQQQLFPAEDALAQTSRDQLLAVVNLYKALGGGWAPDAQQAAQTGAQTSGGGRG